jgi:hypothetical protein
MHACWTWRKTRGLFKGACEIVVGQEETWHRAFEHDDFHFWICLKRNDDLVELRDGVGTKNVEGRIFKQHFPLSG